jgi:hypothetical protein
MLTLKPLWHYEAVDGQPEVAEVQHGAADTLSKDIVFHNDAVEALPEGMKYSRLFQGYIYNSSARGSQIFDILSFDNEECNKGQVWWHSVTLFDLFLH